MAAGALRFLHRLQWGYWLIDKFMKMHLYHEMPWAESRDLLRWEGPIGCLFLGLRRMHRKCDIIRDSRHSYNINRNVCLLWYLYMHFIKVKYTSCNIIQLFIPSVSFISEEPWRECLELPHFPPRINSQWASFIFLSFLVLFQANTFNYVFFKKKCNRY